MKKKTQTTTKYRKEGRCLWQNRFAFKGITKEILQYSA
jgi:hypothetical protein